jgi:hypothetical protein
LLAERCSILRVLRVTHELWQGDFQSCCTRLVDSGGRLVDLGGATR